MRRTHRVWNYVVGLVGPDDVHVLQTKVHDYRVSLQVAVDGLAKIGKPLPIDNTQWSIQQWGDLVGRCSQFETESISAWNPLSWLTSGAAYDRGRELIGELDKWRDELAGRNAPAVPAPVPVPNSDLGLAGGLGFGLAAIVAILLLREMR